MNDFFTYLTPAIFFAVLLIAGLICYFLSYRRTVLSWEQAHPLDWVSAPRFSFARKRHPMERKDRLPLLVITAVYAATAFFGLGDLKSPQSVCDFADRQTREIILEEPVLVSRLWYHTNLGTGSYQVEISQDGESWLSLWQRKDDPDDASKVTGYYWADGAGYSASWAMTQKYNQLYKWVEIVLDNPQYVRYLRITGRPDKGVLELGELALFDQDGVLVTPVSGVQGGEALFDEQDLVPERISYLNSTHFDEIYHPRTAYEHLRGIYPYEVSHPPLGKLIISVGIALFGMTPFGWRFMGTLFGVLMLPILYVFLKNLFGKTSVAAMGTLLFAFDFMHFVQTRIATIDTYGVFFILLAFFFLYRYFTVPEGAPFHREILPLFLCGLFWGIGCASKWTVIYAGAGLAVLYFWNMVLRLRRRERTAGWAAATIGVSLVFFVVIPVVIYYFSYLPYGVEGHTFGPELVWDNQVFMLTYHQGVHDSHPYSSRWWQWVLDIRPILYYLDSTNVGAGMKSAFGAFGSPLVVWGGLLALFALVWSAVRRKCSIAAFLLVGYLAQLLPWVFITRTTFAYHYFPSILFLVLALAYVMNHWIDCAPVRGLRAAQGLTGVSIGLFLAFYPVLTGLPAPVWYTTNFLRWLPSWPF